MNKKMQISFILDETGSMEAFKSQTISGFNEYVETLRRDKNSQGALFTLTKFNSDKVEIVHQGIALADVVLLDDKNYHPNMNTPLYDAVGRTINAIKSKKGEMVLVIIQTDGQENASQEFTRTTIFDLIEQKKKDGWTFVFLGADQDAYAASDKMGIPVGNTANYTGAKTGAMMNRVAMASVNYTSRGGTPTEDFFSDADDKDIV
jgi:hypothetical protein